MTLEECEEKGFKEPDFILVTGDAYVDHPSFGAAIIGRLLESMGYNVAVLSQPSFKNPVDFKRFGRPKLAFLITGGNVDSMVSNYSVLKNRRRRDAYSPGGEAGKRPDRAVIVYSNKAKEAYKKVPVVIGGLEASLRLFAHYDYWDNKLRRSILLDSKADLLVYGMGERSIIEIAEALKAGIEIRDITWIRGTCYREKDAQGDDDTVIMPGFYDIASDKKKYCKSFVNQYENNDHITGKKLVEAYGGGLYVAQNPPMAPLERHELDNLYEMPFEGTYPPVYGKYGGVPSIEEVEFSIIGSRGCFGGCAFCALTYHQGRAVRSRSKESIVREAKALAAKAGFKGFIHDIGGPTANFRNTPCEKQSREGVCKDRSCMYPRICREMKPDHEEYLDILKSVKKINDIKKVFIRSGIRYDYLLADKRSDFLEVLCKHHVSGTLKVAPEHVSENVLAAMRKPKKNVFEDFSRRFREINEKNGMKQYLVPYFISSHPGSTLENAVELALYLKDTGFIPEQVQDFYPTPGTLSTCMYYTGMNPFTLEEIYVPDTFEEKKMQRALLQFHKPENRGLVEKALSKTGRESLKGTLLYGGKRNESIRKAARHSK
jgi:uncharacterized radical SAM protein YgiQ